jgi:hypothetical protein
MAHPRICIAGIEPDSRTHLRPTTGPDDPLTRKLLADTGGPFELGAVVELGATTPQPSAPEVEDHRFEPAGVRRIGRLKPDKYLGLLDEVAQESLHDAFGPELKRRGSYKFATDHGCGECSLVCLRLEGRTSLGISSRGTLQFGFLVAGESAYAPVTDLRFFEDDHSTIRRDRVSDVAARLRRGVRAWAMFGLSRPWAPTRAQEQCHWLQLNGICLEDDPLGPPLTPPEPIRSQRPPRNCL